MTIRKLGTFEEKVNDFLRRLESGTTTWVERDFIQNYSYLEEADIRTVLRTCKEIKQIASSLAKEGIDESLIGKYSPRGIFDALQETMRMTLQEKYPYLEPKRVDRVITYAIYCVIF